MKSDLPAEAPVAKAPDWVSKFARSAKVTGGVPGPVSSMSATLVVMGVGRT
jgi:hypothetical protein